MAISKSVQFSQGDPAAQAYDIQRAQQLAQLLQQQSMQPIESSMPNAPISWTQGLAKMMESYGAKQADNKVRGLLAQKGDQAQQRQQGLIDALTGTKQVGGVDENNPGFDIQPLQDQPGEQPYLNRDKLVAALQGSNPEDTTPALSQLLFQRAQAPQGFTGTLGPDQTAFMGGQKVATNPKEIKPAAEDRMLVEIVDPKSPGGHRSIERQHFVEGKDQIWQQPRAGSLEGMTPGSLDYWVEWSKQNGGANPPGTRSPAFTIAFGKAMAADARSHGDTLGAFVADAKVKAALKPALAQTEKSIGANSAFLNTVERNISDADSLSKKLGGSGSPAVNAMFNAWKRGVIGDPNVRQLDFWNNAIQGEAAKIASGGVGSVSATSDAQIAKQVQLMKTADNYQTWRAAADAIIKEGQNRVSGLRDTEQEFKVQSAGSGAGPTGTPSAAPATGARTITRTGMSNGKKVVQYSDGSIEYAP